MRHIPLLSLIVAVVVWAIAGFYIGVYVAKNSWHSRLIDAGLAHYHPVTGEWLLDAEQEGVR